VNQGATTAVCVECGAPGDDPCHDVANWSADVAVAHPFDDGAPAAVARAAPRRTRAARPEAAPPPPDDDRSRVRRRKRSIRRTPPHDVDRRDERSCARSARESRKLEEAMPVRVGRLFREDER
jgi:hypothetical protein